MQRIFLIHSRVLVFSTNTEKNSKQPRKPTKEKNTKKNLQKERIQRKPTQTLPPTQGFLEGIVVVKEALSEVDKNPHINPK